MLSLDLKAAELLLRLIKSTSFLNLNVDFVIKYGCISLEDVLQNCYILPKGHVLISGQRRIMMKATQGLSS